MSKFEPKRLLKWVPVAIAAVVAGVQQLAEQREQDKINEMDERLTKLENEGEES